MGPSGTGKGRTVVHLVRHGEVHNPTGLLYGRLPDYHLSERGLAMAKLVADDLRNRDIVHLRCSPLERTQETIAPLAEALDLPVITDGRVIEAGNHLEGRVVTVPGLLRGGPRTWWYFHNPLAPSWGERYTDIVARMRAAMREAAEIADGHEAVIVSHQLPIWMARCDAEGRRLAHDPRRRDCTLASVTSFTFADGRITSVSYREPAGELLRPHQANPAENKKFVAGA